MKQAKVFQDTETGASSALDWAGAQRKQGKHLLAVEDFGRSPTGTAMFQATVANFEPKDSWLAPKSPIVKLVAKAKGLVATDLQYQPLFP